MPRLNKRTKRVRSRTGRYIDESFSLSTQVGITANVNVSNISTRPHGCNFRPVWFELEATTAYVPSTANQAGFYSPSFAQLTLNGPDGNTVSISRCTVLGSQPKKIRVFYPKSSPWFSYSETTSIVLCSISNGCLGAQISDSFIRGLIHARIEYSRELIDATCPKELVCIGEDHSTKDNIASSTNSSLSLLSLAEGPLAGLIDQ